MPFDAVANLRLLGEVQRRGLEAANVVIARLTERTNAGGTSSTPSDQLAAMADAFLETVSAAAAAVSPGGGPGASRSASDRPEVLSVQGAAGTSVEVELWFHNYTDSLATDVDVHVTDLIDAHGRRLPADRVTVRPDGPFDLSASSSRSVALTVELPDTTAAGCYRGIVTAAHLSDLWLVLAIEVRGAAEAPSTGAGPVGVAEPGG